MACRDKAEFRPVAHPENRILSHCGCLALAMWLSVVTAFADVSGTVREQGTLNPLEGALVTLQATDIRTTTAADGTFTLPLEDGQGYVIVGAKKFYFNKGKVLDAPAQDVVILLEPVPQDDDPDYTIEYETCALCHVDQYDQFIGSPMSNAGLNSWVHDIYDGTGTAGGMGGFVYTRDSMFADTNPSSECAACHQPEVWITDPFSPLIGPGDPGYPQGGVAHGVACDICHKVADVDVNKINFPGIFEGAITYTRPAGPTHDQVQYGALGDATYSNNFFMRPSYQPQLVAETCAACHQDANDPDENHTYTGVISEPTYLEWKESPYGDPNSPLYATCVDCHMPAFGATNFCIIDPVERDPDTIRHHRIEGTTAAFLENAIELDMTAERNGGVIDIDIDITNAHTGHHVPTGVTVRNMILLVEVWREADGVDLTYTGNQTIHDLGGIGDPAEGYYAGLPGKYYSKVNHGINGTGPVFFTEAFGIQFDNRIPALATDSTSYSFALPAGAGTAHVRARVVYRRAFRFLVDAKQWQEDGHGNPLEDIAPPHFGHLMEMAEDTIVFAAGDADGDGDSDLIDFERFTECMTGPLAPHDDDCELFNYDADADVDFEDFRMFQSGFGG